MKNSYMLCDYFTILIHRSRKSETNHESIELKVQCSDEISSADNKVIPLIGSPRTRNDFKLLESKIQKWKESQVRQT